MRSFVDIGVHEIEAIATPLLDGELSPDDFSYVLRRVDTVTPDAPNFYHGKQHILRATAKVVEACVHINEISFATDRDAKMVAELAILTAPVHDLDHSFTRDRSHAPGDVERRDISNEQRSVNLLRSPEYYGQRISRGVLDSAGRVLLSTAPSEPLTDPFEKAGIRNPLELAAAKLMRYGDVADIRRGAESGIIAVGQLANEDMRAGIAVLYETYREIPASQIEFLIYTTLERLFQLRGIVTDEYIMSEYQALRALIAKYGQEMNQQKYRDVFNELTGLSLV